MENLRFLGDIFQPSYTCTNRNFCSKPMVLFIKVPTRVKRLTYLSPYLTGLRLFCDSWRQTLRVGRKKVLKQSPVIRNFLACVAKWGKVVAKILNMFKKFMRQNSSQNGRKVIVGVSNLSRTCRRPLAIKSQSFWNKTCLRDK